MADAGRGAAEAPARARGIDIRNVIDGIVSRTPVPKQHACTDGGLNATFTAAGQHWSREPRRSLGADRRDDDHHASVSPPSRQGSATLNESALNRAGSAAWGLTPRRGVRPRDVGSDPGPGGGPVSGAVRRRGAVIG